MADDSDSAFGGSIPEIYDRLLVPMIFESYAADLVARLTELAPGRVLEVAAGSGVLTRALATGLPGACSIVASDLNEPMLDQAQRVGTTRTVEWRQADVMDLPFPDGSFDVVVCQFGAMFFPNRPAAFSEVLRVLRPGGDFLFSVWDRIETNEFADEITRAVGQMFPEDPPVFMARTPHGYYDHDLIRADLAAAGFVSPPSIEMLDRRSVAESPRSAAFAYCEGTPMRHEIESRDASRLSEATAVAAEALEARFGAAEIDGRICGFVVSAEKP